jgi:tyrosine-protein kinase Etk/Wzc
MSESCLNNNRGHPLDFLILLVKHYRAIIYTSITATVLVYLVLFLLPNTYRATARLLPPQQNLTLSAQLLDTIAGTQLPGNPSSGSLGAMATNFLGLKDPGDLYASIMTGNTISDRIIKRFGLQKLYRKKYLEDARLKLHQVVRITSDRQGIISVAVTDKSPQRAANIANAYIKELQKLLQEMAETEAQTRLAFLEKEHDKANQKLTKAEVALRAFSEKNSVVQIDTQTKTALEYIATLRAAIDSKEVQIKVLREQATPNNYDVIRLETELKGLREKLHGAETQHDPSSIGNVSLNTSRVPSLDLQYLQMYRKVKFWDALDQLYSKLEEIARMDLIRNVATIQVIDQGTPPGKRANKRLVPALLAGVAVFLLMILVILGRERLLRMREDEEMAQRLSALANSLPSFFSWRIFRWRS